MGSFCHTVKTLRRHIVGKSAVFFPLQKAQLQKMAFNKEIK